MDQDLPDVKLLSELINISPGPLCMVDAAGRLLVVNPAWTALLGYPATELLNHAFLDFVHPDDVARTLAQWEKSRTEEAIEFTNRYRHADGSYRELSWTSRPHGDFVIASVRDITTESKQAADLARTSELHRMFFDELVHGVVYQNAEGRITHANPAAQRLLGLSLDQMQGRTSTDPRWRSIRPDGSLFPGSEHPAMVALRTGQAQLGAIMGVGLPGVDQIRWIQIDSFPVLNEDTGEPSHVYSTFVDVTSDRDRHRTNVATIAKLAHEKPADRLTGVLPREAFLDLLSAALDPPQTESAALVFCDVDYFKNVNDDHSHATGDLVLAEVGNRLRSGIRASDEIGRIGGDEFVLLLRDINDLAAAESVVSHLVQRVREQPINVGGQQITVTISAGVTLSSPHLLAVETLNQADTALRAAKRNGRDQWLSFDSQMRQSAIQEMALTAELTAAYRSNELHAWFQPIKQLSDGAIVGYEALARWEKRDGTTVDAQDWLTGIGDPTLVSAVGTLVLREALDLAGRLPPEVFVSANISSIQLIDPRFPGTVLQLLAEFDVPTRRLVLDVPELDSRRLTTAALNSLRELTACGIRLIFDDFGKGSASITRLRQLPLAGVKLDHLVRQETKDEDLIAAMGLLAGRLGLMTIAEGIETPSDLALLSASGWKYGQGWLLGRPEADHERKPQPLIPLPPYIPGTRRSKY